MANKDRSDSDSDGDGDGDEADDDDGNEEGNEEGATVSTLPMELLSAVSSASTASAPLVEPGAGPLTKGTQCENGDKRCCLPCEVQEFCTLEGHRPMDVTKYQSPSK